MTEWFRVESVHDIDEAEALRWRLAYVVALDIVNPQPKKR